MTYRVTETFDSIQGEGSLQGVPSTFIRLAHCNLACSWCDAAYTWRGDVKFEEVELDELLSRVSHDHVVLTGGEPTFSEGFDELADALANDGVHITVETNGTILREAALPHVDLWSISPKLGSSGQAGSLRFDVVLAYLGLGRDAQLKYVVDGEDDFAEVVAHLHTLAAADALDDVNVYVQPNGLCHIAAVRALVGVADATGIKRERGNVTLTDTNQARTAVISGHPGDLPIPLETYGFELETPYLDRVRWLYERVIKADAAGELPCTVRATVQAHKLAWGNRRGF